jgi:hypothetical protein
MPWRTLLGGQYNVVESSGLFLGPAGPGRGKVTRGGGAQSNIWKDIRKRWCQDVTQRGSECCARKADGVEFGVKLQ